jgi:hypothetical protein
MMADEEAKKRTQRPTRARVTMYQVGFGDCFLLSFEYAKALSDGRKERHILVDFGTTYMREDIRILDIAEAIQRDCNGKLDVVVATHRHKDHISGFSVDKVTEIMTGLEPDLIVRPWTEDPEARPSAKGHPKERSNRLIESIAQAQAYATALHEATGANARGLRGDLRRNASGQLPSIESIRLLNSWARKGEGVYLAFGESSKIERFVPGITVHVLGPPTIEQWPDLTGERAKDPDYWLARTDQLTEALGVAQAGAALPDAVAAISQGYMDGPVRWLIDRMRNQSMNSMMRIVRTLDDALNNTSLILLFEVRDEKLLFGGDAQIENWSYALKAPERATKTQSLLKDVTLYKVGHHGSRNATPRTSLFGLWDGAPKRERRITSLMSTLSGFHGKTEATQVPRPALVEALKRRTHLYSTDELDKETIKIQVETDLQTGEPFALVKD